MVLLGVCKRKAKKEYSEHLQRGCASGVLAARLSSPENLKVRTLELLQVSLNGDLRNADPQLARIQDTTRNWIPWTSLPVVIEEIWQGNCLAGGAADGLIFRVIITLHSIQTLFFKIPGVGSLTCKHCMHM
jgi:hypothetical protein